VCRISENTAAACLSSLPPKCNNFLKFSCTHVLHLWTLLMNSVWRFVGYVDTYHTAVNILFTVLWDVIPCSLVDRHQSVEETCYLKLVPWYLSIRLHSVTSQKTNLNYHIYTYSLFRDPAGWYSGNTLDLYSRGAWFESQLGHWLSGLRFFMVFLITSRQIPLLGHDHNSSVILPFGAI
jgi:hypothetical protein